MRRALDAAVGTFVQAHAADPLAGIAGDPPLLQLAADSKRVRGARDGNGLPLHLLGVYQIDPGVLFVQREMRHKPHETAHFTTALDLIADITGAIVTGTLSPTTPATCTDTAPTDSSRSSTGQPTLYSQLDALDWAEAANDRITVARTDEKNGSRHERRIVRVQPLPKGQVNFPHTTQALLIERYTTGRGDGKPMPSPSSASPQSPPQPPMPQFSPDASGGNGPSNPQHFIRDVTFGEDASRARTGSPPRALDHLPQPGDQPRPPRRMEKQRRRSRPPPQPPRRRPTRTRSHDVSTHHAWDAGRAR
ncbi:hypothetical protein ACF05F_33895 [Rhodococcus erythropolis]